MTELTGSWPLFVIRRTGEDLVVDRREAGHMPEAVPVRPKEDCAKGRPREPTVLGHSAIIEASTSLLDQPAAGRSEPTALNTQ